ncbi:MAG: NADH-quinone oxidoreductase subunit D [Bacillota bacterium]|nr:NADH-quinone oxidoreductase subunit D [Bacillota bacterium]
MTTAEKTATQSEEVLEQVLTVNFGPQHPSTHGVLRVVARIRGEYLQDAEPDLGYLHRCFEKIAEGWTYPQIVPLTDRLDYLAAITNEWAYVLAVEKLLGLQVPERAEYIRVIVGELQRILSHLLWMGAYALDLGATTPFLYVFQERERLYDLMQLVTGARMTYNYLRIGGVKRDLPPEFFPLLEKALDNVLKVADEYQALVLENVIFQARTKGIGVLPPDLARQYAISGPMLRGSGVAWDLRRSEPYSVYDRFDFAVPTGQNGDCYDRAVCRVEEIRQSARIIRQAVAGLPAGEVRAKVPAAIRPPAGEVYTAIESPRGELGVYLVSDGGPQPYRLKWRAPSFVNLQVLPEIARGAKVADFIAILGSIDIILGEVDR